MPRKVVMPQDALKVIIKRFEAPQRSEKRKM